MLKIPGSNTGALMIRLERKRKALVTRAFFPFYYTMLMIRKS